MTRDAYRTASSFTPNSFGEAYKKGNLHVYADIVVIFETYMILNGPAQKTARSHAVVSRYLS